jgi:hypothetical protein
MQVQTVVQLLSQLLALLRPLLPYTTFGPKRVFVCLDGIESVVCAFLLPLVARKKARVW